MSEQLNQKTKKKELQEQATPPVHVVRHGAVAASIWLRQSPSGFGFYDYTLSRSWKAKSTGKAGYSKSFFAVNGENLIAVIAEVSAWITAHPLEATVVRRALLPSEIMNFIPCNRQNGLSGLFFTPEIGAFQDHLEGEELFEEALLPAANISAFERRPVKFQLMKPWTKEREQVFCAPPKSKKRMQGGETPEELRGPVMPNGDDNLDDLFS